VAAKHAIMTAIILFFILYKFSLKKVIVNSHNTFKTLVELKVNKSKQSLSLTQFISHLHLFEQIYLFYSHLYLCK
jgi:hypothetical protein